MKAKFLLAIALLFGLQSFAQTPTPYYSGFDTPPQQANWVSHRKGFIIPSDWTFGNLPIAHTPPNCVSHDYPVGGAPALVEDWWVSPAFDFSAGGAIDSMQIIVFAMGGSAAVDDHFGVYLLAGSPDPALATTVTLLSDYTGMASTMVTWTKISNLPIPSTPGLSYVAFKYTSTGNWFVPYLDDVNINANPNPCPAPASIAVMPSYLSADFTWPPVSTAIGYQVIVNTTSTPPVNMGTPTGSPNYTEHGLTLNTNYYVHVRADCGGGQYSSWKSQSFKTKGGPGPCVEPELTFPELTATEAKVNWKTIPNSEGYEYTLKQTADTPSVSGTITFQNNLTFPGLVPATKYYLFVRTRCQGVSSWMFSNWARAEFFTHFATGIAEHNTQTVNVYPNPATDLLKVEGLPANAQLTITDVVGKLAMQVSSTESNTTININELPSGLYLIKVSAENGDHYTLKFQKQ